MSWSATRDPRGVPCDDLDALLRDQDGVVARFQVLACGLGVDFIRCRLRCGDWVRLHRGVYLNHTGLPSWRQRAWGAVLLHWPAALADESALVAHGFGPEDPPGQPSDRWPVHVAVDQNRRVDKTTGIRVHRMSGLADFVQTHLSPPRLRFDDAVVGVASRERSEEGAIARVAEACQAHRTTPQRVAAALRRRIRLPRRRFLLRVVEDVAAGVYSVLEHRYLTRVERPHGLPTAARQRRVRVGRTPSYRDVEYVGVGLVVELDGRLGHELATDRWADLDRDIASLVGGDITVRVGWRQVLDPCRLALAVSRLLRALGWSGRPRLCGPGCAVGAWEPDVGAEVASAATHPPTSTRPSRSSSLPPR